MTSHHAGKSVVPVRIRTRIHLYDPDDPTPEEGRELSCRAEEMINHAVLDTRDPMHSGSHCLLELQLRPLT